MSEQIWEVWQGDTLICSMEQRMSEAAARNKVENEARIGWIMQARPAPAKPRRAPSLEIYEEEDGWR